MMSIRSMRGMPEIIAAIERMAGSANGESKEETAE